MGYRYTSTKFAVTDCRAFDVTTLPAETFREGLQIFCRDWGKDSVRMDDYGLLLEALINEGHVDFIHRGTGVSIKIQEAEND